MSTAYPWEKWASDGRMHCVGCGGIPGCHATSLYCHNPSCPLYCGFTGYDGAAGATGVTLSSARIAYDYAVENRLHNPALME